MRDLTDNVGDDGLAQPVSNTDLVYVAPLVLVAAGALLTSIASMTWAVSRAWRALGSFTIVLEDGYERKYTDGYWEN